MKTTKKDKNIMCLPAKNKHLIFSSFTPFLYPFLQFNPKKFSTVDFYILNDNKVQPSQLSVCQKSHTKEKMIRFGFDVKYAAMRNHCKSKKSVA